MATSRADLDKDRFFTNLDHLGESDETDSGDEIEAALTKSAGDVSLVKEHATRQREANGQPSSVIDLRSTQSTDNTDVETATRAELRTNLEPIVSKPVTTAQSASRSRRWRTSGSPTPRILKGRPPLQTSQTMPVPVQTTTRRRAPQGTESKLQVRRTQSDVVKPTGRKKVKSKDEVELVTEQDRIFNGLVFFFIPNDDIAKPRKLRIRAAIAHGATWTRNYSDAVTHVIVDVNLDVEAAAKGFPNRKVPSQATLVKDTWLTESVEWKDLQDPSASRFRLKNATSSLHAEKRPAPDESVESLVITKTHKKRLRVTSPKSNTPKPVDELTQILKEVQEQPHLPLDIDVNDAASLGSEVQESDLEDDPQVDDLPTENRGFQCMEKNDGNEENPNAKTIHILQQMATYYDKTGNDWRTVAYRKAMTALRKQKELVTNKEEALAIPGIGERIADKIEEIVSTNRLRRLEYTKSDHNDQILQLFMGIYGAGYSQAMQWIVQGHTTLQDLMQKADLTPNQRIGIEHHSDFSKRIPREEVSRHAYIVKQALHSADPSLEAIVGGSYRRGNLDSSDIDLIITKKDASLEHIRTLIIDSVVPRLQKQGFLKATLASGSSSRESTSSKWHGASCLPDSTIWRRIDLLFVPWDELGAALIYFTGNDIFNRSMRLLASRKGMRLNQHGLYTDVMRGQGRSKMTDGTLLEGKSEKRIFEILGVPWRPPNERKC